jgi:nitrite reductase (cytochrome c-552)
MTTSPQEPTRSTPSRWWLVAAFAGGLILMGLIAALLVNITTRKAEAEQYPLQIVEVRPDEIDPAVWGLNFPRHYDSFMKTQDSTISTPYGGSVPYSKLERYPAMVRIWAGYAFSKDHNEERGHYYSQIDQANTQRVQIVDQPGACINCHAAEAPCSSRRWAGRSLTARHITTWSTSSIPAAPALTATNRRRWN